MAIQKTSTTRGRPNRVRLTDKRVAEHSNHDGKTPFLWDSLLPGFGVRATTAGGRQYTVRYRHEGIQRSLSLGPVEKFESIEEARDEARDRLRLLDKGVDPHVGGDGSMLAVWEHYIETLRTGHGRIRDKGRPASPMTIACAQSAWKTHFADSIGSLPPKKITGARIRAMHAAMSKQRRIVVDGRGGNVKRGGLFIANRSMAYLKSAWRTSAADGLTRGLPDPFEHLHLNGETARSAYLKKSDAPAFVAAVNAEPELLRMYWISMLMLGPRGGELRKLRWADVHIERDGDTITGGTVTFRDTKNHTHREVPLEADLASGFDALPRTVKVVFPITYPSASWRRVMQRAGLTDLRPHDVRRSVGTWLGIGGKSSKQVGALLGHKSDITSKVYIQLADDIETKASAAKTQADTLRTVVGDNVIQFPVKATGTPSKRHRT